VFISYHYSLYDTHGVFQIDQCEICGHTEPILTSSFCLFQYWFCKIHDKLILTATKDNNCISFIFTLHIKYYIGENKYHPLIIITSHVALFHWPLPLTLFTRQSYHNLLILRKRTNIVCLLWHALNVLGKLFDFCQLPPLFDNIIEYS
jgi:hypothetical protein